MRRRTSPITAPQAGGAVDYLNVFHVSVAHWPSSGTSRDLQFDHPIVRGSGVEARRSRPGRWAGEADMIYEPAAWDILVRFREATTEPAEDFQERVKQPPFHRAGTFRTQEPAAGGGFGRKLHRHSGRSGQHTVPHALRRTVQLPAWNPPLERRWRGAAAGNADPQSSLCRRPPPSEPFVIGFPSSSISRTRSGFASRRRMRIMSSKVRPTGNPGRFWPTEPMGRGVDCKPTCFPRRGSPRSVCKAHFRTAGLFGWKTSTCFTASRQYTEENVLL